MKGFVGLGAFMLWVGTIGTLFGPWAVFNVVWTLLLATFVLWLFHQRNVACRVVAVVLLPTLLWTYFLPRPVKLRLKTLEETEYL